MTAAHKAAKAWYGSNPVNADFKPTADRQEFVNDMVRRLTGHLEPYFKAEVDRVSGPLVEALEAYKLAANSIVDKCPDQVYYCRRADQLAEQSLANYRKETNK